MIIKVNLINILTALGIFFIGIILLTIIKPYYYNIEGIKYKSKYEQSVNLEFNIVIPDLWTNANNNCTMTISTLKNPITIFKKDGRTDIGTFTNNDNDNITIKGNYDFLIKETYGIQINLSVKKENTYCDQLCGHIKVKKGYGGYTNAYEVYDDTDKDFPNCGCNNNGCVRWLPTITNNIITFGGFFQHSQENNTVYGCGCERGHYPCSDGNTLHICNKYI